MEGRTAGDARRGAEDGHQAGHAERDSPIWRDMAYRAEPVAKRSGGSGAVAAPPSEGSMSPTPMPVTMPPGR